MGISIADARVEEAAGALLTFTVTLSRAADRALTLDYATADGSAQAGVDYTAASGMPTFQAGESSKTIDVAVLDDAHDEGEETFTLALSNPSAGRLTDDEATGTIENRDPLPKALLARFGRTAAVHVVEHVEERLQAPREPGFRGRFAGRELRRGMERDIALNFLNHLGGLADGNRAGIGGHDPMAGSAVAGNGPQGLAAGGAYTAGSRPMGAMAAPMGGGPGPGAAGRLCWSDGRSGGSGRRVVRRQTAADGSGQRGRADRLGVGDEPRYAFRLDLLVLEPRRAVQLRRPRRDAVARRRRPDDHVRSGLREGPGRSRSVAVATAGAWATTPASLAGRASAVTGLYPWVGYKATDRITVWGVTGAGCY